MDILKGQIRTYSGGSIPTTMEWPISGRISTASWGTIRTTLPTKLSIPMEMGSKTGGSSGIAAKLMGSMLWQIQTAMGSVTCRSFRRELIPDSEIPITMVWMISKNWNWELTPIHLILIKMDSAITPKYWDLKLKWVGPLSEVMTVSEYFMNTVRKVVIGPVSKCGLSKSMIIPSKQRMIRNMILQLRPQNCIRECHTLITY